MAIRATKACLLLSVAASGLAVSQPVFAADEETAEKKDITVTATRREERLIDVPIAITALNSESLDKAGVNNL